MGKKLNLSPEQRSLHLIAQSWCASEVQKAIYHGTLANLETEEVSCVDCGERATAYDHRDYSKPLEVEAVCTKCNFKRGPAKPVTSLDFMPANHARKPIDNARLAVPKELRYQIRICAAQANMSMLDWLVDRLSKIVKQENADA